MEIQNKHLVFGTAFGLCAILFREGPFRAVGVLLPAGSEEELASRVKKKVWGAAGSHPRAEAMADTLRDYFDGKILDISMPPWEWLDFGNLTTLERQVLAETARISPGLTLSYKELAEKVNRPHAYRFVGTTMAKNPFPVIIPCHRVVRSDRTIGKFGGGTEMKRKMIEMEAPFASTIDNL